MGREKVIAGFEPYSVAVGLSSLIGLTVMPGQINLSMQYMSGGTLRIESYGASLGSMQGFIVPTNAILTFDTIGTVWLSSAGATSIVQVLVGRSQGFEGQ